MVACAEQQLVLHLEGMRGDGGHTEVIHLFVCRYDEERERASAHLLDKSICVWPTKTQARGVFGHPSLWPLQLQLPATAIRPQEETMVELYGLAHTHTAVARSLIDCWRALQSDFEH